MSYYNRHEGTLFPGKIAKSEDIHQIQTNIQDAIKNLIDDQYDRTSFILGSRENDFLLSPAPKRSGRYIDTMNVFDDSSEIWLDIDAYGYRQPIKTTKTSLYSVIVKLRNMYSKPQDVSFELWSEDTKISKQTITVPEKTTSSEFEVIFNLEHFSTQHGRNGEDLEAPDAKFIAKPGQENIIEQEYQQVSNPDNHSLGATTLYLVVKAIHKVTEAINTTEDMEMIDENTFMICADSKGSYQQGLEVTADDGRNYESTNYDLYFKHIYSNAPTYLCNGGVAVVHGEPVVCHDTHVIVDGASNAGNTKSYIAMDSWGQLKSYTSHAYWGDESNAIFDQLPIGDLIIAIIYTYNADMKQPKIIQDDNLIEKLSTNNAFGYELGFPIRQRTHHERIRRLEKEIAYQRDISIPSRLKYNLTGEDVVDSVSKADDGGIKVTELNTNGITNPQLTNTITNAQKALDWSRYFITTDRYGNFVVKSIDAETKQIPITLKESSSLEGKTEIELAQTIVSSENVDINRNIGSASLSEHKVETTTTQKQATYKVGITAKEAKETEFNPWDDKKGNRPETADIKPTTREFITKKGVNGVNVRSSEYPAMTLYLPQKITLKELIIPITKFKNVETVQFHIWERQGPNNKHNTVWLESLVYSSQKFSLKNAKTKNGYQILDKPFSIKPKDGLKLKKHQYIILVQIVPKSGDGAVYVETYKPKDSTDFLIRYHGSADCAHFRLKTRYREIWYTSSENSSAKIKAYVNEYYKEGRIESGEVVWENSEPIATITPTMNANIPDGCSIELQANTGNGWKTLTNEQTTKITGGTSSFKWRAILKGKSNATPEIIYDEDKKFAINFDITKNKPQVNTGLNNEEIQEKNVLTTKTFYPGDILQKYIGDTNLNTCDKFSNYEWLRIYGENSGDATAVIDIAASDTRYKLESPTAAPTKIENNISCAPASDEFDVFTMYYADLKFDDFVQESVDYSNYDENIEYDEHNLRFKIDTDRAYNDDDVILFNMNDVTTDLPDSDNATNSDIITVDKDEYITAHFKNYQIADEGLYDSDNTFIWKYSLPGDDTIDLSNYSALKIGFNYSSEEDSDAESRLSGVALYISSAIEQEPPSDNNDVKTTYADKTIEEYENIAPETLESNELESYKNKILKVTRTLNNITYVEYYYYVPDENGVWRRQQLHDLKSFVIYELPELKSTLVTTDANRERRYFTISIDKDNDNFKYIKEIGLITINKEDKEIGFNASQSSKLQITDVKGVIQGYNKIYSAEENITLAYDDNSCKTGLFRDASDQVCSITRIYYNMLDTNRDTIIGYVNNDSFTTDANNFSIQFISDSYIPKDSLLINLCADTNGNNPVFSLNMPTLNHVYYDVGLYNGNDIFNISSEDNDLKDLQSNTMNASQNAYSVTSAIADPVLPDGKTKSDYNEVIYKISIEPVSTTLNVSQDLFKWNVYKQKVTIDKNTQKETYGSRQYINTIYAKPTDNNTSSGTTTSPTLQIKVEDTTYETSVDNISNNDFGVKFDYDPGQYKIKVGFQGYSVLVNKSSDSEHHGKIVTYRSAEKEITLNMFWEISNTVNFAQVYKKINEDKQIQSVSIVATDKFKKYMNTVHGTVPTDTSAYMHIFIKDMVLHEAEHIPLFHPNVRMKIYSKANDGGDQSIDAVAIRKVGAVIEYK